MLSDVFFHDLDFYGCQRGARAGSTYLLMTLEHVEFDDLFQINAISADNAKSYQITSNNILGYLGYRIFALSGGHPGAMLPLGAGEEESED